MSTMDSVSREIGQGREKGRFGYTAFRRGQKLGTGAWRELWPILVQAKQATDADPILVFEDRSGEIVEWDSGTPQSRSRDGLESAGTQTQEAAGDEAGTGIQADVPRRPGRPRLGVVAREVTLLPRHWEWLANQPGGASVALRKLVDRARKSSAREDERRASREATYRFLAVAGGNEPGFEEVIRALFAGRKDRFESELSRWPVDLRTYACQLAGDAFDDSGEGEPSQKSSG